MLLSPQSCTSCNSAGSSYVYTLDLRKIRKIKKIEEVALAKCSDGGVFKVEQPEVSLFLWLLFYAVLFVFLL